MKKKLSLSDIRNTAACLLAASIKQCFPSVSLVGGSVTAFGFYYDFIFQNPFEETCLKHIEEVMQAWHRQGIEVRIKEMVPFSAKEYFRYHNQPVLAKLVDRSSDSSFFLLEIGGQTVLSTQEPAPGHLDDIGAFCLQKSEDIGGRIRIYGTAFFDRKELKDFLKQQGRWSYTSHLALGREMRLFEEEDGKWLWLPKGEQMKSLAEGKLEGLRKKAGFMKVSSDSFCKDTSWDSISKAHQKIFEKLGGHLGTRLSENVTFCELEEKDFSAGLLSPALFHGERSHIFCAKEDLLSELISSLHFMTKIFKILDFTFELVLLKGSGKAFKKMSTKLMDALTSSGEAFEVEEVTLSDKVARIEWRALDGLGRKWPLASIRTPFELPLGKGVAFGCSQCLSIERMIAMLLEKKKKQLPLWISPLQVLVVFLSEKHRELAKSFVSSLEEEEILAQLSLEDASLKAKLHQALQEGIPYVALIGDKEANTGTVSLRNMREGKTQSFSLPALIKEIKLNGSYSSELQN